MKEEMSVGFCVTPCATTCSETGSAPQVAYKLYNKDDAYIEEERGWFEEQGAKCSLQFTPKNSVATLGHLHDALEIIYIRSGSFTAYINGVHYDVGVGDMLFFRSGDIHRIYSCGEDENSYYVIKIHPSLVFDISDKKNGAAYMLLFTLCDDAAKRVWRASELHGTRVEKTVTELAEECKNRRPFFDVAVKGCAARLLLFLLRNDSRGTSEDPRRATEEGRILGLIYKAITYINNNYSNDISAALVASEIGMSYSHFSRSFGTVTGKSFKEYLNRTRIRRAEELLITTDDSMAEITEKCGYGSPSYFIMIFKTLKGMTPYAYRAALRRSRREEQQEE